MEEVTLSRYIANKRKEKGITQKAFAEMLSYTPQAISRFESVNSAFPLEYVDPLCKTLDCCVDDIFTRNRGVTVYSPLPFDISDIGAILKAKREEKNKSQEEVASFCDISTRSLRNYESGEGHPSLQFLESFCHCLSILPSELALKKEEPTPSMGEVIPNKPFYRRPLPMALISAAVVIALASVILPLSLRGGNNSEPVVPPLESDSRSESFINETLQHSQTNLSFYENESISRNSS